MESQSNTNNNIPKPSKYVIDFINKNKIERETAIKIDGHYFEPNVSCVNIDTYGWFSIQDKGVFRDPRDGQFKHRSFTRNIRRGVVDFTTPLNWDTVKYGDFTEIEENVEPISITGSNKRRIMWIAHHVNHADYFLSSELMCKFLNVNSIDDLIKYSKTYYKKDSKKIFLCEISNKWDSSDYKKRYIKELDDNGNVKKVGIFSPNYVPDLTYLEEKDMFVRGEQSLEKLGYKEDIYDGKWKKENKIIGRKGPGFSFDLPYKYKSKYKTVSSPTFMTTEGNKRLFGIEFETSKGYMSSLLDLPLKSEVDGSLRDENGNTPGMEYITIPMQGDEGFKQLKKICKELSKRCEVNYKTSLHVHIGGEELDRLSVICLYNLMLKVQQELYLMLPKSRAVHNYSKKFKIRQAYCQPLYQIFSKASINQLLKSKSKEEYQKELGKCNIELLKFLLQNNQDIKINKDIIKQYNGKTRQHLVSRKWHRLCRYFNINFYNTKFGDVKTIEFRMHSGSLNFTKVSNWVKICLALVNFAGNQQLKCLNNSTITLDDIILFAYPKQYSEIMSYINRRKQKFAIREVPCDCIEEHEYQNDEKENEDIEEIKKIKPKIEEFIRKFPNNLSYDSFMLHSRFNNHIIYDAYEVNDEGYFYLNNRVYHLIDLGLSEEAINNILYPSTDIARTFNINGRVNTPRSSDVNDRPGIGNHESLLARMLDFGGESIQLDNSWLEQSTTSDIVETQRGGDIEDGS